MSAKRRRPDRDSAAAVKRMWQIYADQTGVPEAGTVESNGPRSQYTQDRMPKVRPAPAMTVTVRRLIASVCLVVVTIIAGIALWPGSSSFLDRADRRLPTPGPAPAGDADRITQQSAQNRRAGDQRGALDPMPRPGAVSRHEITQTRGTLSAEAKQSGADVVYRITFTSASDRIDDISKPRLDELIMTMKANPEWRVVIEGHTDAQGSPDYNQALSERRADAVRAYLQSAGIIRGRLRVVGYGASRPVAPNDVLGNVLNRRVDLHRW